MNGEEFEAIFEQQVIQCRETLVNKAREYAEDEDRLHNFKVSAAFQGCTETEALWGMATKHLVSISDMVRKGDFFEQSMWDEKIGDALNYLFLLRAQVIERENVGSVHPTEIELTAPRRVTPVSIFQELNEKTGSQLDPNENDDG